MSEQRSAKSPEWLKRLGGRIRLARRIRGFTQTEIARPNLTKSFISLLESGRTYPSVSTLVALASRLRTSMALLLLETPQLPRETALNMLELARVTAGSNPPKADRLLAAVEPLSEEADDLHAELLLTRGDIALVQGRPRDAERAFSDALAWSRKKRLLPFEPRALARLAHLALTRREEDAGRERLEEALKQFRTTRTLRSAEGCNALLNYGELLHRHSRTARAQRILEEVAQAAQRQDLSLILGRAHLGLARIHIAAGRVPPAVTELRGAKDALAEADDSVDLASAWRTLGRLLQETDELADAHEVLQRALQVQERIGDTRTRAATLDELARVLVRMGKPADAQREAKDALALAEEHRDTIQKARCLVTLAQVARAQHHWKQAVDQFKEAVELFKRARLPADLTEAARELGMLLKERGEHAAAADYLAMAISTHAEPRKRPSADAR
jgi:tetratricopeptide (TPR) repeat protein